MARVVKEKVYAERRNAILDVTQRLVYSKGYERMAIQDILEELEISKGAFYHYFDSKQALLEALIERMLEEAKRFLIPIVENPELSCLEKFQRFFTSLSQWKTAQKDFILGLMQTWYADENAIVRQKVRAMTLTEVTPLLTVIIQQGLREGSVKTPYPDQIGRLILSLLNDLSANLGELLFLQHLDEKALFEQMKSTILVATDAIERILGMPASSLNLVDFEILEEWSLSLGDTA